MNVSGASEYGTFGITNTRDGYERVYQNERGYPTRGSR
jgi:hypothetical protein